MGERVIKIFLGSSISDFEVERADICNTIRNVSKLFEKNHHIRLEPIVCTDIDSEIERMQKFDEIDDCAMCFFIFFSKEGEHTREEFERAKAAFEKHNKPTLYTYFKIIKDGSAEQSVIDFMKELENAYGCYPRMFEHIDTVKFRMLLSIKMQEIDFFEIEAKNGECFINGNKIMSIDNVAEFANNGELNSKKAELIELDREYKILKKQFDKDREDKELSAKLSEIDDERNNVREFIKQQENKIINLSLDMINNIISGDVSSEMEEAYRLFELGKLDECLEVLKVDDEIDFYIEQKKNKEAQRKLEKKRIEDCRNYIKRRKLSIDVLDLMASRQGRIDEITELYEEIIPLIFEEKIELDKAYNYIYFLLEQNRHTYAIELGEKLNNIYDTSESVSDYDRASLYNVMGLLYLYRAQPKKTEDYFLKAIEIREELAANNPERFNPDLAASYNNAGVFYIMQGKPEKAEFYYLKKIEIFEKLANNDPERFNLDLATSYNDAGVFYKNQGQPGKAEFYYLKTTEIYEELANNNPERFDPNLAGFYYASAGVFYYYQGQPKKTEDYFLKAIKISEELVKSELAKKDPERFNLNLAIIYNNTGVFYDNQGLPENAEDYYLKAIKIREELAANNPERFNPDLEASYNNAGVFYKNQGQSEKSEDYFLKAIKTSEELAKNNPERFNPNLATSYNNAGIFYKDQGQLEKTEVYFLKAIEIREELAKNNPRFNPYLATSYNNAGVFYQAKGQPEKTEFYYFKAIKIREELANKNPERFNPDLAVSYNNAGIFYKNQRQSGKAEVYFLKAIRIKEELAKNKPERFNPDLAASYNNAGGFYSDQGQLGKAEVYYLKAIGIYEDFASKKPDRFNPYLATSYNNAGVFYQAKGQPKKAESYFLKAIKIREELINRNPASFYYDLAVSYFCFAVLKKDDNYLDKALELAKTNPDNPICRQIIDKINNMSDSGDK